MSVKLALGLCGPRVLSPPLGSQKNRASAVIGTSFWKVLVMSLQISGREDLVLFDDEARALEWLAEA